MSHLPYRTAIYRGAYAALFVGAYLLLAAYALSGDDSGSENNTGIVIMLIGVCVVAVLGAMFGPRLHRTLFKMPARSRLAGKSKRRSHNQHSH